MSEHASDADAGLRETAGARLREAREAQRLDLADVAQRTRIPTRHLRMIESGELDDLPAPTYSVGFVKTYARLLGLDAAALAQQFRAELAYVAPRAGPAPYEPADPARVPGKGIAWAGFAAAILLIFGYLYWRGSAVDADGMRLAAQSNDLATPAPAAPLAPVPAPTPGAPAPAALAVPAGTGATLAATSPVWIKVYESGGATLKMGLLQAGERYAVPATAADPRLLTSRPNALDVTVGTRAIPTLGPPERRIRDVSLKPDALLARIAAAPAAAPGSAPPAPAPPIATIAR